MFPSASRKLSLVAAVFVFSGASQAQEKLLSFSGDQTEDRFGRSVAGGIDINADGFSDILVGTPLRLGDFGVVRVFSGRDGTMLWNLPGPRVDSRFGHALAGLGDADADGYDDFVVGAPGETSQGTTGAVYVYSGQTGTVLHSYVSGPGGALFGEVVAAAGDINLDGYADFMFTARDRLRVRVQSGRDGSDLFKITLPGLNPFEHIQSLANLGDINGDGYPDLAIGSPRSGPYGYSSTGGGRVFVHSGRDTTQLFEIARGNQTYSYSHPMFGYDVDSAGDVNGDGTNDILVGAPWADFSYYYYGPSANGEVFVFSGVDGSQLLYLQSHASPTDLGSSVAAMGDLNQDGFDDFAAADRDQNKLSLYSGFNGRRFYRFEGSRVSAIANAGDVNGDGHQDVIYGSEIANTREGLVEVFAGNDLYCFAPTSTLSPGDTLTLRTSNSRPGRPVILFLHSIYGQPYQIPLSSGRFNSEGVFIYQAVIPASHPPASMRFQSFAVSAQGTVVDSGEEVVIIQ
jgi:hypothetical protein